MMVEHPREIVCLWATHKADQYPPQFVGAVSEGLRDAFFEESERLRELAETWFGEFGVEPPEAWDFHVAYGSLPVPALGRPQGDAS